MPSPGSSAWNAKKIRTEKVATSKTINAYETGELYVVSGAADIVLTLPSATAGRYFRVKNDPNMMMDLTCSAASSNDTMTGMSVQYLGVNTVSCTTPLGPGVWKISGSCEAASVDLEFVSDGTYWHVTCYSTGSNFNFGT